MRTARCVPVLLALLTAFVSNSHAVEFVTNGDFSAGNTGFTSAATYVASGALSYAQYAVRANPATANGSWCGVDHTTGTGNMLLVDSVLGAAWSQTVNLSPGSYVFSLYVMNVLCPENSPLTQPSLELRVNGNTVAGPMSIAQVSGAWVHMYGTWNVVAAGPVTLVVWSNQNDVNGADFALDDISLDGVVAVEESTWGHVKALYR